MIRGVVLFVAPLLLMAGWAMSADGPLPPKQAAESIKLPPGFTATLFAGEPDIVQPMSIAF